MRGKGTKRCSSRRGGRITPAYAGKSKRIAPSSVLFGDHPRVCGEKLRESRGLNRTRGSPPRMRGKVFDADYSILRSGITPAYAGKSYTRTCYAYNVRDHPRVCGEKCGCAARFDACQGSPPRMRGKEWFRDQNIDDPGITPAYAGKSFSNRRYGYCTGDHPRVCGEKFLETKTWTTRQGSPPRMRGKVPFSVFHGFGAGITPAYAGKSTRQTNLQKKSRDHPRVCGEKLKFIAAVFSMWGSPPRMRGKVLLYCYGLS